MLHLWHLWEKTTTHDRFVSSQCKLLSNTHLARGIIDLLTDIWPMLPNYQACLDEIKLTHCAVPLCVFVSGKAIGIHNTAQILEGAVIKIQYELQHFPIAQKHMDSFNASIQQIQDLWPGEAWPPTVFKCQSLSDSPINVPESNTLHNVDAPSAKKHPHTINTEKGTFHTSVMNHSQYLTVLPIHGDFDECSL